tara:strand:- start:198 stop:527 length:330 start_codon:yes stop_codon:yes gene_type:complete
MTPTKSTYNDLQKKAIEASARRTEINTSDWTPLVEKQDIVNSPAHYTQGKIEVIDFILDQEMDYLTASAMKYLCRHAHKHKGDGQIEDLRKARWFIEKNIEQKLKEDNL